MKKKIYNSPLIEIEPLFGTGLIMTSPAPSTLPLPPSGPAGAARRRGVQVF